MGDASRWLFYNCTQGGFMSRKTLVASMVWGLMVLLAQPKSIMAAKATLAGSWELTLTPSTPPTPPVMPIPGLATFTTDGSLIETDGAELAPGISANPVATYKSPGHGIWQLMPSLTSFYIQYYSVAVNGDGSLASKTVTVATVAVTTSN
jgi:hypothetical protein